MALFIGALTSAVFGVGSEFAWQLQGYVGYRFSRTFILSAGYWVMGVDYENGSDEDRFLFDVIRSALC